MPLITQAYNLASANRWILSVPIKLIDPNLGVDSFIFNLTGLDMPDREIISTEMSIRGRAVSLPTGVRTDSQNVTCTYMLSSDWHQYRFLNKWFQMYSNAAHGVPAETLDISMFVLSEFKQPMFYITFRGCWINNLGGARLNYQDGYNEIEANFSFKYAYIDIDNIPEV